MRKRIDKTVEVTLAIIMGVMVINVLWQVFTRFVLGAPSSFTDELARYLMIWLSILGAAYISGKNKHVSIDVLAERLSESRKVVTTKMVALIVVIFSFAALVIGGGRLVYLTYTLQQHSPSLHVPLAFVYVILPISGLLIIYYRLNDFIVSKK